MGDKTPPSSLKSVLKPKENEGLNKKPFDHNVDFQTVFPGWPKEYFLGILPFTSLGAVYPPEGYPSYNYTTNDPVTASIPVPNSVYNPTTPDPMYVTCMPWAAYPYGIPTQEIRRGAGSAEGKLLAVPTPRGAAKKSVIDFWKAQSP